MLYDKQMRKIFYEMVLNFLFFNIFVLAFFEKWKN